MMPSRSENGYTGSFADPEKGSPNQSTVSGCFPYEAKEDNNAHRLDTNRSSGEDTEAVRHPVDSIGVPPAPDLSRTSSRCPRNPDSPPDGGWRAWSMCIVTHLVLANTWGLMNSFGIFQAFYADFLQLPPSQISWIGSIQTLLHFFLATISGRISDAGYFRHVFALGTFFQILGLFTMSISTKYWQLMLSQGVCLGISSGLLCVPSLTVASTYFDKRRSLAFGIMTCGNVTGGLVFPAMVRQLLPSVGFGWAMRAIGFIQAATMIACNLIVRPRVKPNPSGPLVELPAFKEPPYSLYAAAMFFNLSGANIAFYYAAPFGRTAITPALSYPDSLNLLLIINGIGLLGRLGSSYCAHVFGPLTTMLPIALSNSLVCLAWIAVKNPGATYAWAAIFGITGSAQQSNFPAGLMSLTTDLTKAGVRMGQTFTIVGLSVLVGPPVAGAMITMMDGSYLGAQVYAGCLFFVGTLLLVAARVSKTGGNWLAKI